jgi:hypothetical protein
MQDQPAVNAPTSLPDMLAEEYRSLGRAIAPPLAGSESHELSVLYSQIHAAPEGLSALCISGGGIRSATFAWGALTALAANGLLTKFDYLSTVSGGGYIGSWLSAWIRRAGGIDMVVSRLSGTTGPTPETSEADPVQHLREFNNYLTPRFGLGSADTWTMIAIMLRNLALNWLVMLPLLLLVVLAPRVLVSLLQISPPLSPDPIRGFGYLQIGLLVVAGVAFSWATYFTISYLPSLGRALNTRAQFIRNCLLPMVLCSLTALLAFWWVWDDLDRVPTVLELTGAGLFLSAVSAGCLLIGTPLQKVRNIHATSIFDLGVAIIVWGMSSGAAAYALTHWLFEAIVPTSEIVDITSDACFYATFGPPMLILGLLLGIVVLVGCTSRTLTEEDREWLGRSAAYGLAFSVGWVFICALVLVAPHYLFQMESWSHAALAGVGGVSGLVTALAGNSGRTAAAEASPEQTPLADKAVALLYKLALPAFLLCLLVGLTILTNWLLTSTGLAKGAWYNHHLIVVEFRPATALALTGLMLLLSWAIGRFVNVNKFSLHAMYENRLTRAYLAASARDGKPHPFTGFCAGDDIPVSELRGQRPLHVVNMALNLVSGERLAWQQRKASSFTVSPYHAGSLNLGYRDSASYGGGITLGNAMTISGAAASPNMGYNSSPLVSFTMMLFNARLGSWLGNPGAAGNRTWKDKGPLSAVSSIVREALGRTDDTGPYVYLSDGGHFENLAVYEMIVRRCRYIVVLDSGCDPKFTYEDLGNALRKIRIDLSIRIEFDAGQVAALQQKKRSHAVARIVYSDVDPNAPDGMLLYIKPMVHGFEPPDVLSYRAAHPAFPHETTADQWFTEAQTESYRKLGACSVERICSGVAGGSLADLIRHAETAQTDEAPVSC